MRKLLPILLTLAVVLFSATEGWSLPPCEGSSASSDQIIPLSHEPPHSWTNCVGTYTFADGSKYVGEWKDGVSHGHGTHTFGDYSEWAGDEYVGEFKDDDFHGQGTITFASGDRYVGEFKDGRKNGQGTRTFPDGTKYVGELKDGFPQGQGTLTYADGEVEEGIWVNGELQ